MREIKFRYRFRNDETGEVLTVTPTLEEVIETGLEFRGFSLLSRDQYTGIFDYAKREICEGDLISIDGYATSALVHWNTRRGAWMIGSYCALGSIPTESYRVRVIGNVHQNPDLIPAGAQQ